MLPHICKEFIDKALKCRKLMGGGIRQAGFLAPAGIVALEKMRLRLVEDHQNALLLAERLSKIPGVNVLVDDVHINMVFFDLSDTDVIPPGWLNNCIRGESKRILRKMV